MARDDSHGSVYSAVAAADFKAKIAVDRYQRRTDRFDRLISRTHDHFWDPADPKYLDYSQPFDLEREPVLPFDLFPEFETPSVQKLPLAEKVRLANENARWMISGLLHGEQAAMSLSTSLATVLVDLGAQEYAANQAREEARHVHAFKRYIDARWGTPYEVGDSLGALLTELVAAKEIYKKLVGMQILVEGLAMSLFAVIHSLSRDPLLRRVTQLVMIDETFHHKFGKMWATDTLPNITAEERAQVEDWAVHCFEKLLLNLVNVTERRHVYESFALDWRVIRADCESFYGEAARRQQLKRQGNVFRVLVAALVRSNVVTARTRPIYERWVDLDDAEKDSHLLDIVGEAVFREGITRLREINDPTSAAPSDAVGVGPAVSSPEGS